MSATDTVERPVEALAHKPGIHLGIPARAAHDADLDSLMRVALRDSSQRGARDLPNRARRDYDTAFDLMHRASEALEILQHRCEQLEAVAKEISERASQDIEAADRTAKQWERIASDLKDRVDEMEKLLAAEQQRAEAAERRASVDGELATRLHDNIISSFGIGSRAHTALTSAAHK